MTTEKSRAHNEAEIRALIEGQVKSVRAKDVDGLLLNYTPDVLVFDLINPLRYTGLGALKKRVQEWFSQFQGAIDYEARDLNITAGDDLAFCHSLDHVSGTTIEDNKIDMWWRATLCFSRIDDKWMVKHAHNSEPFDMNTGLASLDLKP
jgi:uncharacterized protein (TIGR02246 family)